VWLRGCGRVVEVWRLVDTRRPIYIRWVGVAGTSKIDIFGSAAGCKFSTDRDTWIASLIPDASLASLIPIQIGTLHAQVYKFGHQWKFGKFCNYARSRNHASSLDSVDVINETHWLQVRRFRNPVSMSTITLQCARAEYKLAKLAP
jgi:hypothetical protein